MTDRELMQQALDALECSKEAIEEWGSYASPYFQAKHNLEGDIDDCQAVIEALRARLEKWTADDTAYRPGGLPQEEQELVAWSRVNMNDHKEGDLGIGPVKWDASAPLVVHPHPAFQATQPQQHSEQWWRHEVSNAYANGYEKGRASVKQPEPEPVALGDSSYDVDFRDDGTISVSLPDGDELVIVPPQPKQKDLEPYCYTWDKWISSGTWEAQYGWKPYYGGKRPEHVTDAKPLYTAPLQREWQGLTDEELREFEIWLDEEEEKHGWNPPADIVKYIEAKLKEKNG